MEEVPQRRRPAREHNEEEVPQYRRPARELEENRRWESGMRTEVPEFQGNPVTGRVPRVARSRGRDFGVQKTFRIMQE